MEQYHFVLSEQFLIYLVYFILHVCNDLLRSRHCFKSSSNWRQHIVSSFGIVDIVYYNLYNAIKSILLYFITNLTVFQVILQCLLPT